MRIIPLLVVVLVCLASPAGWAQPRQDMVSRTKARRLLPLPAGVVFTGVDGLYVHGESLVGIQNSLRPERVVQGFLSPQHDRITRFRVLESAHPSYDVPTTGVIVGNSLTYIATTQLGSIDQEGKLLPWDRLKDIVVLKLDLSSP